MSDRYADLRGHTPGPWRALRDGSGALTGEVVGSRHVDYDDCEFVALVTDGLRPVEDRERLAANVALVVKAPTLLSDLDERDETIRVLVEALGQQAAFLGALADELDEWAQESLDGGWSTHQVKRNRSAADKARRKAAAVFAALARARGES